MKNVKIDAAIYRSITGDCFAAMDDRLVTSLLSGSRFFILMDSKGQHEFIHERNFYLFNIGFVQVNDANDILRLLVEMEGMRTKEQAKTILWAFKELNPFTPLTKRLELWKR